MLWVGRAVLAVFLLVYLFALAVFVVGEYGLFGMPKDPLAGILILPLGLPWILFFDPESNGLGVVEAALCPLVNFAILYGVYRIMRSAGR